MKGVIEEVVPLGPATLRLPVAMLGVGVTLILGTGTQT